jgi:ABC-type spermidine/putrescine transport system permease subunit I
MEFSIENLNKAASTNGLIIGIISTVIGVVTYYVFPSMLGSI